MEAEQTAKLEAEAAQDGEPLAVKLQKAQLKTARTEVEAVLPKVILGGSYVPVGCKGLILAGLLAAFMSTFVSTVNSGAAYVVNDIYKRYFHPDASPRRLVTLGYLTSIAVIVLGILFGYATQGVHSITEWIVSGLVPAFVAPNVLKWHWWRFNGFGFFAGMVAGTAAALALPPLVPGIHPVSLFWSILAIGTAASVVGCLLTPPDREETLKSFYRTVRPWGWWGPIYRKLREELPALERNRDFPRDALNLAVGLVWQTAMVALPIYVVLQQWGRAGNLPGRLCCHLGRVEIHVVRSTRPRRDVPAGRSIAQSSTGRDSPRETLRPMSEFIHDDFLLKNEPARRLYHEFAAGLPIIDYHNHLDPCPGSAIRANPSSAAVSSVARMARPGHG